MHQSDRESMTHVNNGSDIRQGTYQVGKIPKTHEGNENIGRKKRIRRDEK